MERLIGGIDFGEGPRWHEERLWYSDFHQRAVYAVGLDGERVAIHDGLDDRPSGLGWLPDGSLLVVAMTSRRVWREVDGTLVDHADLSELATGDCNDMVVDARGNAYVGNFGFDYYARADPEPAALALVRPGGTVELAAEGLAFPNGSVVTPDGETLIVGESFGQCYTAFSIAEDGTLGDRRTWAATPGMAPDGCTLDAEGGIWFADALDTRVVRVVEGGSITAVIDVPMKAFACALGGPDGRTLFVVAAPSSSQARAPGSGAGAIFTTEVAVPHAGLP